MRSDFRQPRIYYDITRLLSRSHATTPRGIDRVDLQYALYCLSHFPTLFIYQKSSLFYKLETSDAEPLLRTLSNRWSGLDNNPCSRSKQAQLYKNTLGNDKKKAPPRGLKKKPSYLDPALKKHIQANQSSPALYMNTSHSGTSHYQAFIDMREAGIDQMVFYLHDTIPVDYPAFFDTLGHKRHIIQLATMATHADLLLVNSVYTQTQFQAFCRDHQLPIIKADIMPIGLDKSFTHITTNDTQAKKNQGTATNEPLIDGQYFISVGAIEHRKNHLLLFKVWLQLVDNLPTTNVPKLVLIDRPSKEGKAILSWLDQYPLVAPYIVVLQNINDRQLVSLMQQAEALLFPSLIEGWGIPIVEAQYLGLPVLCSDIEAFRESSQGLATFLDNEAVAPWCEEITRILQPGYRETLCDRLIGFKTPNWAHHFMQLDQHIQQLYTANKHQRKHLPPSAILGYLLSIDSINTHTLAQHDSILRQTRLKKRLSKLLNNPRAFFAESRFAAFRYLARLF